MKKKEKKCENLFVTNSCVTFISNYFLVEKFKQKICLVKISGNIILLKKKVAEDCY